MKPFELEIIRAIETDPEITQRQLAQKCYVSLGKMNYCVNSLIQSNIIKKVNKHNRKKFSYVLSRQGMERKVFLLRESINEYQRQYSLLNILINSLNKELYKSETKL